MAPCMIQPPHRQSPAAWLSHWAEDDQFEEAPAEPPEAANPQSASHAYAGTKHWFAEPDRPEVEDRP